ncbi:hypothetical protein V2G26_003176 [Clonostachys chloroleuca]
MAALNFFDAPTARNWGRSGYNKDDEPKGNKGRSGYNEPDADEQMINLSGRSGYNKSGDDDEKSGRSGYN